MKIAPIIEQLLMAAVLVVGVVAPFRRSLRIHGVKKHALFPAAYEAARFHTSAV